MMRTTVAFLAFTLLVAVPLSTAAQDGPLTMAHAVKVDAVDAMDFQEAAAEHMEWHASQDDPWTWSVYQAMTGEGIEFVAISSGHTWADFDTPGVDPQADLADWVETGAEFEASSETVIWTDLLDVSHMPPDGPAPVVQVFEWEITGDEDAVMHAIRLYKESIEETGADASFVWSRVVSGANPNRIFVAVFHESMADVGEESPDPAAIMAEVHGEYAAEDALADLGDAWKLVGSRIWTYRPDLSHTPGIVEPGRIPPARVAPGAPAGAVCRRFSRRTRSVECRSAPAGRPQRAPAASASSTLRGW